MSWLKSGWIEVVALIAVVIGTAVLYWVSIDNGMVWDDYYFLNGRPEYFVPSLWWQTLSDNFILSVNYFRPAVVGSLLIDIHVLGGGASTFHRTNVLIFLAACVVVFFLSRRLLLIGGQNPIWAVAAVLLFGCSPVLSEVVLWISARFDLMLMFFLLLVLLADVSLSGWLRLSAVFFAYLGAALSKEMAVAFGFVIPIWHIYIEALKGKDIDWRVWLRTSNVSVYLSILLAGLAYLWMRYQSLGALYYNLGGVERVVLESSWQHFLLILKTIGGYFILAVGFAQNISPVYPLQAPLLAMDVEVVVGLVTILLCLFLLFKKRIAGLILVAFLLSLLPVLHLAPLSISGNYMHQRFIAFPYALVLVMVLPLIVRSLYIAPRMKRLAVLSLVGLAVVGVLTIRSVIPMWQSNYVLWTWVDKEFPAYTLADVNLMVTASGRKEYKHAVELGESLLADSSVSFMRRSFVHAAMAESYFQLGDYEKMEFHYTEIFSNYGVEHIKLDRYSRIYSAFARSLYVVDPASPNVEALVKIALEMDQYNDLALLLRAIIQAEAGEFELAKNSVELALNYAVGKRKYDAVRFLTRYQVFKNLRENDFSVDHMLHAP